MIELLDRAADQAVRKADDPEAWYVQDFLAHREERLVALQGMIMSLDFPAKRERGYQIVSDQGKLRQINPYDFYPWSVLYHAIKILLEPIVERVLIADSSAGRKGKGQVYAALRTACTLRRHRDWTHGVEADLRKCYPSTPHWLVEAALNRVIDDWRFVCVIVLTLLDFKSDVEEILAEEQRKKALYCPWAAREQIQHCDRGVTIGNCLSQLITNLALWILDYRMVHIHHAKGYHRHCDDIRIYATSQEEANWMLATLDRECLALGLCVKATSCAFPIRDDERGVKGRELHYMGYVFWRDNTRMKRFTKHNFAKKLMRVKSRRRQHEICASYWGIAKWGRCKNMWNSILKQKGITMSFKEYGIKGSVAIGPDGKRIFFAPSVNLAQLVDKPITIIDYEVDITINGEGDRCAVLFSSEEFNELRKTITTSKLIRQKLVEAGEKKVPLPIETVVRRIDFKGGWYTYDFD